MRTRPQGGTVTTSDSLGDRDREGWGARKMHKKIISVCAAAFLVLGAPAAAFAVEPGGAGSDDSGDAGSYTPVKPHDPTLAGSTLSSTCVRDVPWIDFSVVLNDPDGIATSHDAALILSDGANSTTIPLGTIVDGVLSGRVLWPGAAVDAAGKAAGWPGWEFRGGEWRETDGNFRWTRGDIHAEIKVNPEISLPLGYPAATPACGVSDPTTVGTAASITTATLPRTGGEIAGTLGVAAGAVALVAVGGVLIARRRKA